MNSQIVPAADGSPRLIRIAVFDAAGRQDYERELLAARRSAERSEARVRVLQESSSAFTSAHTPAELFAEVARRAVDAGSVTVMASGPDGTLRAVAGSPSPLGEGAAPDARRPDAQAARDEDVVVIENLERAERAWPEAAQALERGRVQAMTATPLLGENGVLGVLSCFFGRQRARDEDEVELLRALARQAVQALQRLTLQGELQRLAAQDPLTGLANRGTFESRLSAALARQAGSGRPLTLMFIDLDGFKAVNDELGHAAGDAVLVHTAQRLRAATREDDALARFGGDEFVLLCEGLHGADASGVAEGLRTTVQHPLPDVPDRLALTASVGVAWHLPSMGSLPSATALLQAADQAMYASKRAGKNQYTLVEL